MYPWSPGPFFTCHITDLSSIGASDCRLSNAIAQYRLPLQLPSSHGVERMMRLAVDRRKPPIPTGFDWTGRAALRSRMEMTKTPKTGEQSSKRRKGVSFEVSSSQL